MRRAVRIGLVGLGAAMAVYGAASLTGGWLGTPPWEDPVPPFPAPRSAEERAAAEAQFRTWATDFLLSYEDTGRPFGRSRTPAPASAPAARTDARGDVAPDLRASRPEWHRWAGLALCELGVVAVRVGAWPRRRAAAG